MTMQNDPNTDPIDALFDAARAAAPTPSRALMARVLADAAAAQPRPVRDGAPLRPALGWAGRLRAMLRAMPGGMPGLAGVSAAAVSGLWIGFVQPAPVVDIAGGILLAAAGFELLELIPEEHPLLLDAFGAEG